MDRHAMDALVAAMRKRPGWDEFSKLTAMDIHRDGAEKASTAMGQDMVEEIALRGWDRPEATMLVCDVLACLLDEDTLREVGRKLVEAVADDMSYEPLEEAA